MGPDVLDPLRHSSGGNVISLILSGQVLHQGEKVCFTEENY